MGLTDLNIRTW